MPFKLNWKLTVFSGIFLCVFINLGIWQVERGYEKRELIAADKERRAAPGKLLEASLASSAKEGMPVVLQGKFNSAKRFLRDNVVLTGQVGYELIVPFELAGESAGTALVNIGFIPMARTRTELPVLPKISNEAKSLKGHVYLTKANPMESTDAEQKGDINIVQSIDPTVLGTVTGESYYAHMIRLDEHESIALPRHWPLVVMLPEKHFGYALTWFLMAIAVLIAFVSFTVKENKETNSND